MKILFLLTQDLASPSGAGRYGPLARQLAHLGHSVSIAALHPDFANLKETSFIQDGVAVHYVAPMHVRRSSSEKSYYPGYRLPGVAARATWSLAQKARQIRPDLLHVGKPHPMNGLAALAARMARPVRLYLDCDDFEAASGRFGSLRQQEVVARFERWYPHRVRAITTNTNFMRSRLESWGIAAHRISYLPNGIERNWVSALDTAEVERLRSELDLVGKKVIAFIGSLSLPSHPVDILLRAFAALLADRPQIALLLVGGGESLGPLKDLAVQLGIQQAVRFAGQVAPDRIPSYYRLAAVSVDPVYDDDAARGRCPLKLFESWASEVPFVTADVGDRAALLENESAGLLARPGDPASFAQKIGQILESEQLAINLRQAGQARVSRFYWENLVGDLVNFYLADERHLA